jgi:hypothetical protein
VARDDHVVRARPGAHGRLTRRRSTALHPGSPQAAIAAPGDLGSPGRLGRRERRSSAGAVRSAGATVISRGGPGRAGQGRARPAWAGHNRHGRAGPAWQGTAGMARPAWHGRARPAAQGGAGSPGGSNPRRRRSGAGASRIRPGEAGQIPLGGGSEPVRTGFGPVTGCRAHRGQADREIHDHAGHDRARRATEADGSMANRAGRTARWRIGPKRPDRFAIDRARHLSQPVRQNKAAPRDHRVLRRGRTATQAPRST